MVPEEPIVFFNDLLHVVLLEHRVSFSKYDRKLVLEVLPTAPLNITFMQKWQDMLFSASKIWNSLLFSVLNHIKLNILCFN